MSSAADSRQALLDAAEQLYAAHGIEGVSMRDIATAAGQRNNSAVQYHFGSREGLLLAIFQDRMRSINQVRRAYLDDVERAGRGSDVRALVEAEIRPLTEFLAEIPDGSYYARFLARVSPSAVSTLAELSEVQDAGRDIVEMLVDALTHLPRRVALTRIDLMFNMMISALALVEQRSAEGLPQLTSFADTVDHLIDMAVGALLADRTGAPWKAQSHPEP
ncbi:TetR/AcrR family transcriptional regulator [Rhodococcus sp. SJ-2]